MMDSTDMSTPVTRGELREELELFATKRDLESLATKRDLESLATKRDLDSLATKLELDSLATKRELELWGGALRAHIDRTEQRLSAELARHVGAIHEAMAAWFAASGTRICPIA
jgi:hypothetical protein